MSNKNANISELSEKEVNELKANIIYDRLKSVYNISSDEKLGRKLADIGKTGMANRRNRGNYDPDEIARAFPDINRDWVFSDDLKQLQKLPVRQTELKAVDSSQVEIPKGGLSRQAKRELFEQIESILKILKDTL